MKILHVAYIYPPGPDVADGITNVVHNVTMELARRGHHVEVYTSNSLSLHSNASLQAGSIEINGVGVHYTRCVWRYKTVMITPSFVTLLLNKARDFDIIHIHDCRSFQGISTYLFSRTKNIPYVYQPHGSYLSPLPGLIVDRTVRIVLDRLIASRIVRDSSKIIALSRKEADLYRDFGVEERAIDIIPNGVDLSKYNNLPDKGCFREKFSIDSNKKIVLYVGRIHRTKGIEFLIKAYASLLKRNHQNNTILVISGPDDGFLSNVRQLVISLGISTNVMFPGFLTEKDKISAYVDSSIVVSPERFNVFLLVPLEAAACCTPSIVTASNAIGNILRTGHFGLVVGYGDITGLSLMLDRILNDDEFAIQMGENGRKFVFENFGWPRIVDLLERAYDNCIVG